MALNAKPMYVASSNIFFYYESSSNLLKITLVSGIISLIGYIIFIPLYKAHPDRIKTNTTVPTFAQNKAVKLNGEKFWKFLESSGIKW